MNRYALVFLTTSLLTFHSLAAEKYEPDQQTLRLFTEYRNCMIEGVTKYAKKTDSANKAISAAKSLCTKE